MNLCIRNLALAMALATFLGCSSTQYLPDSQLAHGERVTIVERGATATSAGVRLLGILPLAFPSVSRAERSILKSAGARRDDTDYFLVNRIVENNTIYVFLFSIHTLKLRADVARVDGASSGPGASGSRF